MFDRLIRRVLRRPYVPETAEEQNAKGMWEDAARSGGFYWGAMVGQWRSQRAGSVVGRGCDSLCGGPSCNDKACTCDASVCIDFRLALIREEFED